MNKFQIKLIKDALEDPSELSTFEYDFINSLAEKDDDFELSEKQNHILNRIGEKYL